MDAKLVSNLGGRWVIAQRIGIGPVAHEGSAPVLPGRTAVLFLVGGHCPWRDRPHPTGHQRQGGHSFRAVDGDLLDRKSTRLNSSHVEISYAVFCLKKKND